MVRVDPIDDCNDGSCKWDDRQSLRWVAAVDAASWEPRGSGEGLKRLDCPRCGHPMSVLYAGGVIAAAVSELERLHGSSEDFGERIGVLSGQAAGAEGVTEIDTVPARCNCTHPHDGRPDAASGCGQWGVIEAPQTR